MSGIPGADLEIVEGGRRLKWLMFLQLCPELVQL